MYMMKQIFLPLIFSLSFLTSGCATASGYTSGDKIDLDAHQNINETKMQRDALIGKWYRKQEAKNGGVSEELTVLKADGSYIFQFRTTSVKGEVESNFESGIWGVSGGYHFTMTIAEGDSENRLFRVNPNNHRKYWVYKVLELNDSIFRYQTLETGNIFEIHKVPSDFRMP